MSRKRYLDALGGLNDFTKELEFEGTSWILRGRFEFEGEFYLLLCSAEKGVFLRKKESINIDLDTLELEEVTVFRIEDLYIPSQNNSIDLVKEFRFNSYMLFVPCEKGYELVEILSYDREEKIFEILCAGKYARKMNLEGMRELGVLDEQINVLDLLVDLDRNAIHDRTGAFNREEVSSLFAFASYPRAIRLWVKERLLCMDTPELRLIDGKVQSGKLFIAPWETATSKSVVGKNEMFFLHQISGEWEHVCEDALGKVEGKVDESGKRGTLYYLLDGVSSSNAVSTFLNVFLAELHSDSIFGLKVALRNIGARLLELGYNKTEIDMAFLSTGLATLVTAFRYKMDGREYVRLTSLGDSVAFHLDKEGNIKQMVGGESYMRYALKCDLIKPVNDIDKFRRSFYTRLFFTLKNDHMIEDCLSLGKETRRSGRFSLETSTVEVEEGDVIFAASDWIGKVYKSASERKLEKDGLYYPAEVLRDMAIPKFWLSDRYVSDTLGYQNRGSLGLDRLGFPNLCLDGFGSKLFLEELRSVIQGIGNLDLLFDIRLRMALDYAISMDDKSAFVLRL